MTSQTVPSSFYFRLLLSRALATFLLATALISCSTGGQDGPYNPVEIPAVTHNAEALQELQRFSFGSCNKQYLPQPLWKKILKDEPQLFVWTGDVVYADTEDMGKLSQIYASQLRQPEYASFLDSGIPIIGLWDDHDYGENNGSETYAPKKESQKLFLDFIGEPKNSLRRKQDGIYTSYSFGKASKSVRFILLDSRSHRANPKRGRPGDILGAAQWSWLEAELARKSEGVTFLVSSIQALPFEQNFEKWQNFPESRQRLLALLDQSPAKNLVILSGDRHFAELSRLHSQAGKDIWEVTSSGLTHAFRNPDDKRNHNSLRVGPILDRLNYGLVDIDWKTKSMRLQVRDLNQTPIIDQSIPILE